jgi:hypothetical protein
MVKAYEQPILRTGAPDARMGSDESTPCRLHHVGFSDEPCRGLLAPCGCGPRDLFLPEWRRPESAHGSISPPQRLLSPQVNSYDPEAA